tara:strand:- start:53 stop:1792 length:1740 start_codon:yes stop_codon:yes gene_type:complete
MSETNVQLFPGVFRTTQGGSNPDFFLHSAGRVGIGNDAPGDVVPPGSSSGTFKLNVTGHAHVSGTMQANKYYGDGSNLSGTALPWQQATSNPGTDIKYDNGGKIGIGGEPSSTNILKVHGTVEATSFSGIQASDVPNLSAGKITTDTLDDARIPTLNTSKISGLANSATIEATTASTADRIVMRDASGDIAARYVFGSYLNMSHNTETRNSDTIFYSSTDSYIRKTNASGMRSSLGLGFLATVGSYPTVTQGDFRWQYGGTGTVSHANYGGHGDWYIRSNHSSGKVILQDTGGNVGIGNSTPGYKLDVSGTMNSSGNLSCGSFNSNGLSYFYDGLRVQGIETSNDYADSQHDYWTNWNAIVADAPYLHFGLYVQYNIRAQGMIVTSDERIKCDFIEIDDTFALDKLRQLKPTSYRYKDKLRRTTDRVLGFIAQEVAEVLPDAVSITKEAIPNIQIEASIKKIDEKKFELTLKEPHSVNVGAILEIRAPKLSQMEVEVISVIDDTTFTILAEEFDIDKVGDRVIVYGERVDDFHNLNKNAIWTVATAALQEVDRQLQAEKEKVKSLEERLAALEAIVLNQ